MRVAIFALPLLMALPAQLPDARQVVLEVGMGSHQKGIDAPYGLHLQWRG